jgi:DNA invertase Pin-like site-specific DNA recombinase
MAVDPIRAAQYVRMSTEHQRYSIEFQMRTNETYAEGRGYQIVRTYADAGVSGLHLRKRQALQQLLADVLGGTADFSVVLVYDVSRWGRFQDPDESAHYEFVCREAGVRVEYCAEPFENDGSLTSVLVKQLKRAMAAEYVRELSARMRRVQRDLSDQGYWMGGPCTYGFRRCVVAPDGTRMEVLQQGQRKALQGYRVVLVAGPDDEVQTVRRVFSLFVVHGLSMRSITNLLNAEGVPSTTGRPWTEWRIRNLLTDEKCIGNLMFGRHSSHLKQYVVHPRSEMRRVRGACPVLVNPRYFAAAQANIRQLRRSGSDEDLVAELRGVLDRHGALSHRIIANDPQAHSANVYCRRFGSLEEAFARIGYQRTPTQARMAARAMAEKPHLYRVYQRLPDDEIMLQKLRELLAEHHYLTADLINRTDGMPRSTTYRKRFGSLVMAYRRVGYIPTAAGRQRLTRA